ncbi:MAG: type II toxin-antitoxin system prevent-host-death family antitoxin [Alphaproteobacteria bacterium]|nr:type II toxin-antitoxin system prevent-host-death family antitoxin [Alphaproteobacteria bacterium]
MITRSVAEAKNQLSQLINRALDGEPVVITRHGRPVVELRSAADAGHRPAVEKRPRRMTPADLEWLEARRLKLAPGAEDAVTIVSRMRDEDEL